MSVVAAVVVPAAPALLPGVGGAADPLADLGEQARALVAETVTGAKGAPRLVVVGAGGDTRAWSVDAPTGSARFTTGRVPEGALPTAVEIGRAFAPSEGGELGLRSIAADAGPTECAALGRELADDEPTVLVVVADGPATLSEKAPGHLHPDAAPFALELGRALADADTAALAALDPVVCDQLWMQGRPALQVLAAAAPGLRGELLADAAPFGVQYLLARWT